MKSLFALLVVTCISYGAESSVPTIHTAYGYLKRSIEVGERIRQQESRSDRIVGGVPAGLGQYPYQAGLLIDIVGLEGRGVCGGSLLNQQRVITAAHCWHDGFHQAWRITVALGTVELFTGGTRVQTSAVITHPSWFPLLARNDVAIVYLPTPISFSGATISANQSLYHVNLRVISNRVCRFGFPLLLHEKNICTSGVGGLSTCQGDSGGPLVINRNNKRILIGVTSFGIVLGCEANFPAAYARVTSFIDFIKQNL